MFFFNFLGYSFSLKFQCIRLMVFAVVILFVCLAYGGSAKFQDTDLHSADLPKTAVDYLLCRYCGTDISPLSSIISIDSPSAIERRVSQLFDLKDVKVQIVKNSFSLQFEIITLSKTLCIGEGNVSNNVKLIYILLFIVNILFINNKLFVIFV